MRGSAGSGRETIYSPVRHSRSWRPQQNRASQNQASLRNEVDFIQPTTTTIDDQIRRSPSSSLQQQHRLYQQQQQRQNFNNQTTSDEQESDQSDQMIEEQNQAKEVYIWDCCCVSKQLEPSIKFMSTFKTLFFFFNFFVLAFGLADFGMGLWFRIDPKVYEIHKYIETQNFTIAGWILLFGGFLACLMAIVGFAAATHQAAGLLVIYFSTIIVLTLAFVGAIVLLTVYGLGSSLENFLIKEIYEQIRRRTVNSEINAFRMDEAVQFLDFVQVKLRCCGAANFQDYEKLGMFVPTTCYAINKNYITAPGCGHALRQLLDLRAGMALGFTTGSIVAQLATIITSALMFCSIYHWRAIERASSSASRPVSRAASPAALTRQLDSPASIKLYHQQPRTRTPIVI